MALVILLPQYAFADSMRRQLLILRAAKERTEEEIEWIERELLNLAHVQMWLARKHEQEKPS